MQSRRVTIDEFNVNIMDTVKVQFDEVEEPNKILLLKRKGEQWKRIKGIVTQEYTREVNMGVIKRYQDLNLL